MATNRVGQCHTLVFNASASTDRQYVCKVCSKAFKRSEHRLRHERAHTQEKPFRCRYCHKCYSRRDLVARHERTLHASQYSPPNGTNRNKENCKWFPNDDLARSSGPIVGSADAEADYDSLTDEDSGEVLTPSQSGATIPLAMDSSSVGTRQHSETPSINKHAGTKRPAQEMANHQFRSSDSAQPKTQLGTIPPRDQQENLIMQEDLSTEQSGIVAPTNDIVFPNLDFFDPFLGLTYGTSETFGFDEDLGQLETFSPLTQLGGSDTQQNDHARRKNNDGGAIAPFNTQPPLSTLPYEARTTSERVAAPFLDRATKCLDNPSLISKPSPGSTSSTTSSMPRVVKPSKYKRVVFGINATTRMLLYTDLSTRLTQDELWDFEFPDATTLDKCLRSYADAFHVHLPILHLSTLAVSETPSPLVLMICAIGALYRLERKLATSTYRKASQAFNRSISSWLAVNESLISIDECRPWPEEKSDSTSLPLWMMQTRFLLAAFSSLNGNAGLIKRAFTLLGAQWIDCHLLLSSLSIHEGPVERTWKDWTERESLKRIFYGMMILSHMLSTAYGLSPAFSTAQIATLEMPGDQDLWDAPSEARWLSLTCGRPRSTPICLGEAVSKLLYDKRAKEVPESCWSWSPFATCVVMHAVAMQIWHISTATSLGMLPMDTELHQLLANPSGTLLIEAALNRCRELLICARKGNEAFWSDEDEPMLFNCMAVLQVTYGRACMPTAALDRSILLREHRNEIIHAIRDYLCADQPRSESITKAVARSIEGLFVPVQAGVLWTMKTAALTWWVDHALAGWDTALFVTRWIHAIEQAERRRETLDSLERKTIQEAHRLVREAQVPLASTGSLASAVANFWAPFFTDTWVWGVTPRIGFVLQELAREYEKALATPYLPREASNARLR